MKSGAPRFLGLLGLLGSFVGISTPAHAAPSAPTDWYTSVYSPGGVEVRADERLFTLYALLNALGYDQAPVVRKEPVPKHEFSAVRVRVRQALATLDPRLKEQVSNFFDAHPLPLSKYVAYTLSLGPAPSFSSAGAPAELAGFDKQLAQVYEAGQLHNLFAQVQQDYRADTRGYLAAIDQPLTQARKLLHDPKLTVVLAVNDLDGQGLARGIPLNTQDVVLVLGPDSKPDVQAMVRALGRVVLDPVMAKKATALKGAAEQAAVARGSDMGSGAVLESGADYASELLARALAIKVASTNQAADEEAALKLGYVGIKEAVKGLDDLAKGDKPLDVSVPDLLAKIDLKKAALARGN